MSVVASVPGAALAYDTTVDGVYGRLRGDGVIALDVGGGISVVGPSVRPAFTATARLRYLDMAGVFVGYDNSFGSPRADAISLGVDLRPLMFARIFSNWEVGPRWVDVLADSVGLDLGVAWVDPGAPWRAGSGIALAFGGGAEFPLVWRRGDALMLRLGVRWIHATDADAQSPGGNDQVLITLGLTGRLMARLGLVGGH